MGKDLWKLKRSTDKKCPDCGRPLAIRERDGKEIICCSYCEYSETLQAKRIRRKTDEIEEPIIEPKRVSRGITRKI